MLRFPAVPSADELVHPYLAPVATIANHWFERTTFHGGAFVHGQGAWAVLGGRGAGKSSLLGWCTLHGLGVVTDDALALQGMSVFAGPRCVDLRPQSARRFGIGRNLGLVRDRERWRVELGPIDASLPLAGWVALDWGESVGVSALPRDRLLQMLMEQRGVNLPVDPVTMLDLLGRPAVCLTRPQRWEALDAAHEALMAALA